MISVAPTSDYRLVGDFRSTLPPKIVKDGDFTLEEFAPMVTWQVPVEFRPGADLSKLSITGSAKMQVCRVGTCLPPTEFTFDATLAEPETAPVSVVEYRNPDSHVTLRGYLEPRVAVPGSTVNLVITADPAPEWHIYEWASRDPGTPGNKPTVIGLSNTSSFYTRQTTASAPPVEGPPIVPGMPPVRYYEQQVKWTTPIVIPKDAKPGKYPVEGYIGYQVCLESRCDLPRGAKFTGTFEIASTEQSGAERSRSATPSTAKRQRWRPINRHPLMPRSPRCWPPAGASAGRCPW